MVYSSTTPKFRRKGSHDGVISTEALQLLEAGVNSFNELIPLNVRHKLAEGRTMLSYIIGDSSALNTFLDKQKGIHWLIPKYLNALFRGVGQVIFLNNPFSGFLVLFALYWADLIVGIATTLAASTAILTAFIFVQDESKINNGLTTYNAVLVGSVTSSLWTPTYGEPLTLRIWGFIILAAALSVLVNSGLASILGSFKPSLPSFTLAFNTVTILLFTTVQPRNKDPPEGRSFLKPTALQDNEVHLVGIVQGIILSMGEVYAIDSLIGSIIMYMACLIYSPIVLFMSLVGATVGTIFGIAFAAPPYDAVYNGIWGFNGILAAISVGGFFFIPNGVSFLLAVADVMLVVFVQQAMTIAFTPLKLPFLTFPFVLSSIIMLEVTATLDKLHRVDNFSFPEMHIYNYLQTKLKEANHPSPHGSSNSRVQYQRYEDPNAVKVDLGQGDAATSAHFPIPSAPSMYSLYPNVRLGPEDIDNNYKNNESFPQRRHANRERNYNYYDPTNSNRVEGSGGTQYSRFPNQSLDPINPYSYHN